MLNDHLETLLQIDIYVRGENPIAEVQSIIDEGLDLNGKDSDGHTPLTCASAHGEKEIVKLFLKYRPDVNLTDEDDRTALHYAAFHGWEDVVQSLLDAGANVHARDSDGDAPLTWAVLHRTSNAFDVLLKAGADCNFKNKKGKPPFYRLLKRNETGPIRQCVDMGAYVDTYKYWKLLQQPLNEDSFFRDVELCSKAVVNEFNRKDLPALYEMIGTRLPAFEKMKIKEGSGVAMEVKKCVAFEIQTKGYCDVLKASPIVLCFLCVKSFINCSNKNSNI